VRFIGSYKTKEEAQDAYKREFESYHGYPTGYNVQTIPKIDKVWPTWKEQKARLASMNVKPVMPVIGLTEKANSLVPLVNRMRKVNWLARNCMVVLDDHIPIANSDIAVQSRGQVWHGEIKRQGKNVSIYGSTAIDKDSKRILITLFEPAFNSSAVLAEEVYHMVYRIIGNTRSSIAKQIQRWYGKKVKSGLAIEDVARFKSDLPASVLHHAKKLFSPSCRVPDSVFKNMMAIR